jgi:hypothetical protein
MEEEKLKICMDCKRTIQPNENYYIFTGGSYWCLKCFESFSKRWVHCYQAYQNEQKKREAK